jgi:uncharacterized protein
LVIDTNVLISSFFGGNPKRVIDLWRTGKAVLCLSDEILREYLRVIVRLPIAPETKRGLLAILQEQRNIEWFSPPSHHAVIKEDPEDDKFIDCAVAAKADCLISGDAHLLKVKKYQTIPIISPKDFLPRNKS